MTEQEFIQAGFRIAGLLSSRTNSPHTFSCGVTLCTAETHMIELIGEQEGISSTMLCEILGVTKGAVSQILKKLKDKNLAECSAFRENGYIALRLTSEGQEIFEEHRKMHVSLMQELYQMVESFPQEQKEAIHWFLNQEEKLAERLADR